LILELSISVLVLIISGSLFSLIINKVLNNEIATFDNLIIYYIQMFKNANMDEVMLFLSFMGDKMVAAGLIAAVFLLILYRHKHDAKIFSILVIGGAILNHLLKIIYHRPRPIISDLVYTYSFSFPSGHSMVSFIFYFSLAYFIYRIYKNIDAGIVLAGIAAIIVIGIGISRIYLGVHYPSDVIAGYAAGMAWISLIAIIEKAFLMRQIIK